MLHIICLIVLLAVVTFVVKCLNRGDEEALCRTILSAMLAIYIMGYMYFAFFSREVGSEPRVNLVPFQSYVYLFDRSLDSARFATSFKLIGLEAASPGIGMILNILLYYPLGYLLPSLLPKLKAKHVILIGCLCSIATEAIQYFFVIGCCETDDVIHNTLGTTIGVLMYCVQRLRFTCR